MKYRSRAVLVHPKKKEVKYSSKGESFHEKMGFVLVLAQCFGLMPVEGFLGDDVRSLYFTWRSWRTLYCCFTNVSVFFVIATYVYAATTIQFNFFWINSTTFFVSSLLTSVLFLSIAKKWPQLMEEWTIVEISMRSYGRPRYLGLRLKIMTAVVMALAIVEHAMVNVSNVVSTVKYVKENETISDNFFRGSYPIIFGIFGYSLWKGIFMQMLNLLATFTWTFGDLFIMLMSTALALRFKLITDRLRKFAKAKVRDENIWRIIREDYNRVSKLCRSLDDAISYMVLVSFGSNLFFILAQLFNSLREMKNTLEKVYFFFSFGFLISRTVCVSLYGAWINDESKKPVAILNSIPSDIYNTETRRLIQQISFDDVCLTGRNFFKVTRGLILSMAGAVVTYELVLIQFNAELLKDIVDDDND